MGWSNRTKGVFMSFLREKDWRLSLVLFGVGLCIGLGGCDTTVEEEEDLIRAEVSIGFDSERPFRKTEAWVPIKVQLTNNTDPIHGDLLIRLKDGRVVYRKEVDLPTRSPKIYEIYAYMKEFLDELEFYIETDRRMIPVELVTVSSMYDETDRILAVMSPERGTHDNLVHHEDQEVEHFRRVLYSDPMLLPEYWVGYRNINGLLWDGGRTLALNEKQEKALDQWIQMGGTLILAAGEYWQELSNSAFNLYVPMTLDSSLVLEEGTQLDVYDSEVNPELQTKFVIATGNLIDDPKINVLMEADGNPFLVERRWGAGRILFVASGLDQPLFKNEVQQEIFLDYLTETRPDLSPNIVGGLDQRITSYLTQTFQSELPSTWFIGLYLGVYILLVVPVNYFVFRKMGRLEWAWLTIPVWAILFAVGVYYIGALRQQGHVAVNGMTVIEAHPNASHAQASTFCSIYSPVRKWYRMDFGESEAFPVPPRVFSFRNDYQQEQDQKLTVRFTEQGPRIEDFLIYHWSQNQIKLQHRVEVGEGIEADLDWSQGKLRGMIRNETGYTLREPVIYMRNVQMHYESLEDGETLPIEEGEQNPYDYAERSRQLLNFNPQQAQRQGYQNSSEFILSELNHFYAASLFDLHMNRNLAVLTAEIQENDFSFRLNNERIEAKGSRLFVTVFDLKAQFEGEIVVDPNSWEFFRGGMRSTGRVQSPRGSDYFVTNTLMHIMIRRGEEQGWAMLTRFPMEGGRIQSLQIWPNYQSMRFGRGAVQQMQQGYGMGMAMPRRGERQNFQSIFGENQDKPPLEHQLQIRNHYTKEYEFLSEISDEQGQIRNPALYVDRIGGRIEMQMKAGEDWEVVIPREAINIRLGLDFTVDPEERMLGRIVESEFLGKREMESPEGRTQR